MSTTTDPDSEPLRVPLSDQLGLDPKLVAFAAVCAMLPEGAQWGDRMTPKMASEIVQAATAAERERCAASERSAWNAAVARDEEIERLRAALARVAGNEPGARQIAVDVLGD